MSIRKAGNCEQNNVCRVRGDLGSCEVCASAVPKFWCQSNEYWLLAVSVSSLIVSLSSIVSYCLFFKLVVLTNYQLYKKKPFKMPEVWHVIWKTAHVSEHNADPNFSLYLRIIKSWKLKNLWKKNQSCDRLLCTYTLTLILTRDLHVECCENLTIMYSFLAVFRSWTRER